MKTTENLKLKKPELTDFYDVENFNENADIIDEEINKLKTTSVSHSTKGMVQLRQVSGKDHSGLKDHGNGIISIAVNGEKGTQISGSNELYIEAATESDIDAKSNVYKPIVPSTLVYAVESVTGKVANMSTKPDPEYSICEWLDDLQYKFDVLNDSNTYTKMSDVATAISELNTYMGTVEDCSNNAENLAQEAIDKANIKKNPIDTTGDIIDTHFTVGTRMHTVDTDDIGSNSFTSGTQNRAIGTSSIALGTKNTVDGNKSFAIGSNCDVSASMAAVVGGINNSVTGDYSNIYGGSDNTVSGYYSNIIGGSGNSISGRDATIINGVSNTALDYQVKTGHYAKDGTAGTANGTTGDAFTIGNGSSTARANCFRVDYAGNVYGLAAFKASNADYAEYFEWLDGNPNNEDRRGLFVTLDGEKIKIANNNDDYILGVVSATPIICGDTQSEAWHAMYQKDIFGSYVTDESGNMILNPDFNPEQEYISRENRKEWSAIGMMGKLIIVDDGTCEPNGYCSVGENGKGTSSETGYRVLSRIDETHVKILI